MSCNLIMFLFYGYMIICMIICVGVKVGGVVSS